jgi:hypothetical protein
MTKTLNPNAQALGRMGRGIPKTMTPEALAQRKAASAGGVKARQLKAQKARHKQEHKKCA